MPYTLNPTYAHLKPLIENISTHFSASSKVLYDKRNVIRVVNYEGTDYVVKAFKVPNLVNRFAYRYLRASKAKRSYDYSLKLGAELTPEPVAYIEDFEQFALAKSYYISTFFDYDHTIHEVLINKTLVNREAILRDFAEFTYELHQQEILHHDYSHGNILIKETPTDNQFKVIDINRMAFGELDLTTRLENFAKIKADDEDMAIIIGHYAELMSTDIGTMLTDAIHFRDEFYRKRGTKNKLRNWLGLKKS